MLKDIFLKHMRETLYPSTEMSRFLDILKQLIRTQAELMKLFAQLEERSEKVVILF